MQEILEIHSQGVSTWVGHGVSAQLARLWRKEWRTAVIIADSNTGPLFAASVSATLSSLTQRVIALSFPSGEAHKNRDTKASLEDAMFAAGVTRDACVVALGGGLVCDLAGFVAATYMRGLPHLNLATTLVAQVDAAHGGKTGLNTPAGKNLVGAFHQPRAVLVDLDTLAHLPERELRAGLVECVKHAVVADRDHFLAWEGWARDAAPGAVPHQSLIARSIEIKLDIVSRDPEERGERKILNFGHTVGHALEMATAHAMSHGEAVAVGMAIEARVAETLCGFAQTSRLELLLTSLGLPLRPPCTFEEALPFLALDKKNSSAQVHCALPRELGQMSGSGDLWTHAVSAEVLSDAWSRSCP